MTIHSRTASQDSRGIQGAIAQHNLGKKPQNHNATLHQNVQARWYSVISWDCRGAAAPVTD